MAKATPSVRNAMLVYNGDQSIQVGSSAWWAWLDAPGTSSFRFEEKMLSFTARREQKGGGLYWYAYRKQQGRLRKTYLGRSEELSWDRMAKAASVLLEKKQEQMGESGQAQAVSAEGTHSLASLPLLTKLSMPPPRHELVARPRLYERLDQAIKRKLTVISAPAGFGKTTLISAWRVAKQINPVPLAWVALDEGDNDPARFWNYIIAALQSIQPGLGAQLTALLQVPPTQWPPMEAILTVLINAITSIPQDFVLALDDYHLISFPTIAENMTFLLEHQPPRMHLILLSRIEPSLPLGRLRACGELCELHSADLRFTTEEIAVFLNSVMGLHLSKPEIKLLGERTEGWVAGLQLAALSMQGRQDTASFIATFTGSHHHILEYLSAEVLARQPAAIQDFLLSTSLLGRLNAALCDAVTQRQDSQAMLALLEQANLFLIPLDEERHWYRYHHLFAEFLRARLARQRPGLVSELQHRAIVWYEEHGFVHEAIEHSLHIEDFPLAAQMVAQASADMIKSGELMTLLSWLTRCPDELVRANPRLSIYFAGALGSIGQLEGAEIRINDAQQGLREMKAVLASGNVSALDLQQLECELGAIRTFIFSARADVQGTIEVAQETLKLLPAEDAFVRSLISAGLGQAYLLAGDMPRASEVFRETRVYSEASDNIHALIASIACEGYMLTFQGKPHAAEEVFQQALHLTNEASERLMPGVSLVYTGLGALHYDWNNLDKAIEYLRHGIKFGHNWGYMLMLSQAYAVLALALYVTGHTAEAMALFDEAEQLMRQYSCHKGLSWLQCVRARIWLMQGNLEAALGWVQASGFSIDDPLTYMTEYEHITLARVLLAQGRYAETLFFLDRLSIHMRSEGRYQDVTIVLILKTLLLARQGEREQALSVLEEALRLGEPAGSLRPFIDEGRPMLELLKFALTRGLMPEYVRRLLAAFPENERNQAQESSGDLFLSEREREVLRLLVAGRSNQQIANAFVVAVSTVKTHLSNIYLKLGVHSRTQAIVRAKELQLL